MTPINQPTAAPSTKVQAGALGGAVVVVLLFVVKQFSGVDVPAEVAAALTAVVSFVFSYLVRERV